MRLLLAGLWARRGINLAIGLVIGIATCAAVLGPMYGRAASEHLVDVRLDERAPYTTGITFSVPAADEVAVPQRLIDEASDELVADPDRERYWPTETPWLLDEGGSIVFLGVEFVQPLYWREGLCDLAVVVTGECPTAADEVLVQETTALALDVVVGDRYVVDYVPPEGSLSDRPAQRTFRVVGTYRIDDPESVAWFDPARFQGVDDLRPPPLRPGAVPDAPALLADPSSMTSPSVVGGVDRAVDRGAVDLDTLDEVERLAIEYQAQVVAKVADRLTVTDPDQLDIANLFGGIDAERTLFDRITVAALVPLLVLALLLLHALVSASTALRRPYVALAKLRGHPGRRVLTFAVGEPVLVLVLVAPLALGAAVLLARLIASTWLTDGVPVVVAGAAWAMFVAFVVLTLGACVVGALPVLREPLSRALSAALPETTGSRAALVLRSAVVAVAAAVVGLLLSSDDRDSQVLALVAPLVVSLAVAVGGSWLLRQVARGWTTRTAGAARPASYLASRRLARRPDLAQLMVPLLLAVSVVSFAVTTSAVSDAWRESRARATVGADRTYLVDVSAGRLLQATHDVDPDGQYLMAAAFETGDDDLSRRLFVDSPRLARVAAWDPSWSDRGLEDLQDALAPSEDRITFTGSEVAVTVADVDLAADDQTPTLALVYTDPEGEQRQAVLGVLRNGAGGELSADVSFCATACTVDQLLVSGDSQSVLEAEGRLRITGVRVDGADADWRLTDPDAWRAARPFVISIVDPPALPTAGPDGLLLDIDLGELPRGEAGQSAAVSGIARITPSVTPDLAPLVIADDTTTEPADRPGSGRAIDLDPEAVRGVALDGLEQPMLPVARVAALPLVGSEGGLADLSTSLVEHTPPGSATVTVQLWTAPGTPQAMLDELDAAGVPLRPVGDLDETRDALQGDAFSLALRVFLVVALATALLAVLGTFAGTVLQTRWRSYEVASLRLVRLPRGALVRATLLEYGVMLGLAVVLGMAAAVAVIGTVLPSLDLGPAEPFAPPPDYAPPWGLVVTVGAGLFVVAAALALVIARRTARLGRPASLRWAEQA